MRQPYRPTDQFEKAFKWLAPGLAIKRWLVISLIGLFLIGFGLAVLIQPSPIFVLFQTLWSFIRAIARLLPSYISGSLVIASGLFLLWLGQTRTLGSITDVLIPDKKEELVDKLLAHRRLTRGPKVVALGGGTGLSTLLRGLKSYSANITAVVTVADNGGSSGRLRKEMGGIPPGDIRNCLAALADQEKLITELFQYRFETGDGLAGHSFGNLFLSAMNQVTNGWEQAIAASSEVLAVRGQVLPATLSEVNLWAELEDGRRIEGESEISSAGGKIRRIGCHPENPPALPRVLEAIREADLIVLGPGSLYTSIIPNLLVPEITKAIAEREVPKIYVCNIMSQRGETDGYTVSDHVKAIHQACGQRLFRTILAQKKSPTPSVLVRYAHKYSFPIPVDRTELIRMGCRVILANVMDENVKLKHVRHSSPRLGRVIIRWFEKTTGLEN